jgi:hypothetical protein
MLSQLPAALQKNRFEVIVKGHSTGLSEGGRPTVSGNPDRQHNSLSLDPSQPQPSTQVRTSGRRKGLHSDWTQLIHSVSCGQGCSPGKTNHMVGDTPATIFEERSLEGQAARKIEYFPWEVGQTGHTLQIWAERGFVK